MRDQVFVCYSHQDAYWHQRLMVHLKSLSADASVDVWDDNRIRAGQTWREEINQALDRARVGVVMVSANMLASDFIRTVELEALLQAAQDDGATIIPVNVSASRVKHSPLEVFQAQNPPDQSLEALRADGDRADRILVELTERIEEILQTP